MIDKEVFRKTEGRLYRYYKQLKIIEKLKNKVVVLWKQKEEIEKEKIELKNLNIDSGLNIGIDYSREKIQASSDGSSQAEREIIKYIDNLDRQYKYIIRKILKTNARIRELEYQDIDIEFAIRILGEVYKQFVLLKYRDGLSFEQIGIELHMSSKSTVSDWREKIVKDIAKLLNIS